MEWHGKEAGVQKHALGFCSFLFFCFLCSHQPRHAGEDLTHEAKYTALMFLFVQARAPLSETLIASSLKAQRRSLVPECFHAPLNNEATAKQTVTA